MAKTKEVQICYLCGLPLKGEINRDHVPPKQLYGTEIRKVHSPNLLTLPVHMECNQAYQYDEDYFVNTLVPLAKNSPAGNAVLKDNFKKYHEGQQKGLITKIFNEFERYPSGIILPKGKVVKRIEGDRVHRIAWKIIRGLFFHHEGKFLPEDKPTRLEIVSPDEVPSKSFLVCLVDKPALGRYPAVFDYRYHQFKEVKNMYYWALLLWDQIILLMAFHDLDCDCNECQPTKSLNGSMSNGGARN
ncbi:MAG: hypothetical protein ACE5G9_06645 [Nitrospinales bacterium]